MGRRRRRTILADGGRAPSNERRLARVLSRAALLPRGWEVDGARAGAVVPSAGNGGRESKWDRCSLVEGNVVWNLVQWRNVNNMLVIHVLNVLEHLSNISCGG